MEQVYLRNEPLTGDDFCFMFLGLNKSHFQAYVSFLRNEKVKLPEALFLKEETSPWSSCANGH